MRAPQCGNPVQELGSDDDKWHHDGEYSAPFPLGGTYTYRVIGMPTGWTAAQASQAVRDAFDVWEQYIGVSFIEVTSNEQTHIQFTPIDGPGGKVGQTWLNLFGGSRNSIDIDTAESWVVGGAAIVPVHRFGAGQPQRARRPTRLLKPMSSEPLRASRSR